MPITEYFSFQVETRQVTIVLCNTIKLYQCQGLRNNDERINESTKVQGINEATNFKQL